MRTRQKEVFFFFHCHNKAQKRVNKGLEYYKVGWESCAVLWKSLLLDFEVFLGVFLPRFLVVWVYGSCWKVGDFFHACKEQTFLCQVFLACTCNTVSIQPNSSLATGTTPTQSPSPPQPWRGGGGRWWWCWCGGKRSNEQHSEHTPCPVCGWKSWEKKAGGWSCARTRAETHANPKKLEKSGVWFAISGLKLQNVLTIRRGDQFCVLDPVARPVGRVARRMNCNIRWYENETWLWLGDS